MDALPQAQQVALDPTGTYNVIYSGPKLASLLTPLGAEPTGITVSAADGYQAEITAQEIADHAPLLATRIDGQLMAWGLHGPTMIVFPPVADTALAAKQVWAIIHIPVPQPQMQNPAQRGGVSMVCLGA